MARRRKQKELLQIGDVLRKALKRKKINLHLKDTQLADSWEKAVGPIISAHTYASNIKGETLFVKVSTSTWMHQLQFMKQEIIEKVNSHWENQTIKNIYFSIGDIPPSSESKPSILENTSDAPLRRRDREFINTTLASVSDADLKDLLKRVMTKEILNRRSRQE